jgi:hypothetical protein
VEPPAPERTALLIVRAWIEIGDGGLRARITRVLDLAAPDEVVATVAGAEEVLGVVRSWLDDFAARRDAAVTAP